jgi:hypothetical protein
LLSADADSKTTKLTHIALRDVRRRLQSTESSAERVLLALVWSHRDERRMGRHHCS